MCFLFSQCNCEIDWPCCANWWCSKCVATRPLFFRRLPTSWATSQINTGISQRQAETPHGTYKVSMKFTLPRQRDPGTPFTLTTLPVKKKKGLLAVRVRRKCGSEKLTRGFLSLCNRFTTVLRRALHTCINSSTLLGEKSSTLLWQH